jgi:hypothetical protein
MAIDPFLNTYFNCDNYITGTSTRQGRLTIAVELSADLGDTWHSAETLSAGVALSGEVAESTVFEAGRLSVGVNLKVTSYSVYLDTAKTNWVKWSKIGSLDFTQDHSNVAGQRPMDWSGNVYAILRLRSSLIIYGANGISVMSPKDVFWNYETIFKLGTKGRHAQISIADQTHYFIDSSGYLWKLGETFERLGYKEFLSTLVSPVMSYDPVNDYIYMCDGTRGFVYSLTSGCLSKGPVNITGFISRNGVNYTTAPAAITNPAATFTTGIYDFDTRKEKTIFNLEVGLSIAQAVQITILYRTNHASTFSSTPTVTVTHRGIAYLPCYGIDFKFKFDVPTYAAFSLDYFKVNGVIHGFSFIDSLRKER